MKIFGLNITRNHEDQNVRNTVNLSNEGLENITPDLNSFAGGHFYQFGTTMEVDANTDEFNLITKYREIADQPEISKAINNIINDIFSYDEQSLPVEINLDNTDLSESTKKKVREEFETILRLLNFKNDSYDIFKRWYVDGRIYYHKVVDEKNLKKGIQQLRYIDPRKIKKMKVRENKRVEEKEGVPVNAEYQEFFIYNPDGVNKDTTKGLPISTDSITYVHSGILSKDNRIVQSNLHKSIRFFNCLRSIEDAVVIYRLSRAAEKRVFNVEVGDLPSAAAESHLQKVINKFRKKLSFNPQTGEVIEQKRHMSMMEDFWFVKRDGKGTTVDVLPGGQNLDSIEDVEYFRKKLYESLNVPISRLDPMTMFSVGRASEITREELNFQKFINRLRKRFSYLFDDILKTQLLLKNIIKEQEWNAIKGDIFYDFIEDNHFTELKEAELITSRMNSLRDVESAVGVYYSKDWVRKKILLMSEEEIEEQKKLIEKEAEEEPDDVDDESGSGFGGVPTPQPRPTPAPKPTTDDSEDDDEVPAAG